MARKAQPQFSATLPSDLFAEAQAVGAALISPAVVETEGLMPEHFYDSKCGIIFRALKDAVHAGVAVDDNAISQTTGVPFSELHSLRSNVHSVNDYSKHASKIKESYLRRQIMGINSKAYGDASSSKSIADICNDMITGVASILNGAPPMAVLEGTVISVSDAPSYKVSIRVGSCVKQVVVTTDELTNREMFRKKVIDVFLTNPILPDKAQWNDFVTQVLAKAKHEIAPEEANVESMVAFYLREWQKGAVPATSVEDLTRGYIQRDGYIFFLPERVRHWIMMTSKHGVSAHQLWLYVQGWGGIRKSLKVVGSDPGSSRRLWGVPQEFFEFDFVLKADIDLSFLQ